MSIPVESVILLFLVFIRVGGLLLFFPIVADRLVPVPVRVAFAMILTFVAHGFAQVDIPAALDILSLGVGAAGELFIGMLMGFSMRMIFYAVELAGQVITTEMGLLASTAINPVTNTSWPALGNLLFALSTLLFFLTGSHHKVIYVFVHTFQWLPVGGGEIHAAMLDNVIRQTGKIFLVAAQMAAPFIAVNFVVTFSFSVLGRAVPGMPVFIESFTVRIMSGLALLGLVMVLLAQHLLSYLSQIPNTLLGLFQ